MARGRAGSGALSKESPFINEAGKLVLVRVTGQTMSRVAEGPQRAAPGSWLAPAAGPVEDAEFRARTP